MNITWWSRALDVTGGGLGDHPLIATCDNTGERLSKPLSVRAEEHFLREPFSAVAGPSWPGAAYSPPHGGDLAKAEPKAGAPNPPRRPPAAAGEEPWWLALPDIDAS